MSKKEQQVDLKLIKQFVTDLEASLTYCEIIDKTTDLNQYIIEMSRASGLAAGMAYEATALVADIYATIRNNQAVPSKSSIDYLGDILGGIKGPGNAN